MMSHAQASRPRWFRSLTGLCTLCFTGTFVFEGYSLAMAQKAANDHARKASLSTPVPIPAPPAPKRLVPPRSLQENLRPLSPQQAARLQSSGQAQNELSALSLLDDIGHLKSGIAPHQIVLWQQRLHASSYTKLSSLEKARLQLWQGEVRLARDEEPLDAVSYFATALRLAKAATPKSSPTSHAGHLNSHPAQLSPSSHDRLVAAAIKSISQRDIGFSQFYSGRYAHAAQSLRALLTSHQPLVGLDRRAVALFQRHASACAGYHADREKLGITEPTRLDPLCGVEALAACLRDLHLPSDKKTVLPTCRVTGEGSNLQDIIDAAHKFQLTAIPFSADAQGLQALHTALVAYVEHDHFVALTKADKEGVTYLCSDCGLWPGGEKHVTWKQWKAMEAGPYLAICKPGSLVEQALRSALQPGAKSSSLSRANGQPKTVLAALPGIQVGSAARLAERLTGHLVQYMAPTTPVTCGNKPGSNACACQLDCPKDAPGKAGEAHPQLAAGPSSGDPVNLATGEEEYTPADDIEVYNPTGPSVKWGRLYNSLRAQDGTYQFYDFGMGWSHNYNIGVIMTTSAEIGGGIGIATPPGSRSAVCQAHTLGGVGGGSGGGSTTGTVIFPNGSRFTFTAPSTPSATSPVVACTVPAGIPYLVEWDYTSASSGGYVVITAADRTKWVTTTTFGSLNITFGGGIGYSSAGNWYPLGKVVDRNGNYIQFTYTTPLSGTPLLSSIADRSGSALLTFTRTSSYPYTVQAVSDRYGRSVYYHTSSYANTGVGYPSPTAFQELDHVSQIVTTGTYSPPDRYAYGYQLVSNGDATEQVPFLHTITVPSPTGTGTATATINYATDGTCVVTSIVDANGNSRNYSATDMTHTLVTVKDPLGNTVYSYAAGFDSNMSETTHVNSSGVVQSSKTFSDPNDPYRPSAVTDAFGHTSYATWDQYGNCLTSTSARGTVTTCNFDYTNLALGEMTQIQTGSKIPISISYYASNGLVHTITSPKPGHAGDGITVTSSYTYDSLGNILTETNAGNNAASTITTTYNYTTDGTYTQSAAIHQPLTLTDNLGHVSHMRYDSRANLTSILDASGNETDLMYDIANLNTGISFAATGSTGTGHIVLTKAYLYPTGPMTLERQYNESGTLVFQVAHTLGAEGEELGRSGSLQPYSATYDAMYRPVAVSDGNAHATQFFYTTAGYAWKTVYPNGDVTQYTSFNSLGQPTSRTDGRGVVTNYSYTDVENKLTDIQYPASTSLNVHQSYDSYGRMTGQTDGAGSHAFTFDDLDKKTTDTVTYTGLSAATLTYGFYPDGSRSSLTLPDGTYFSYLYDAVGNLSQLTNPSGQVWTWQYQNNNWLSQQNANSQVITALSRNARGVITDMSNTRNDLAHTLLSDYQVTYGSDLTVGTMTANIPAAPTNFSGTNSYTHDSKLQLTNETSTRAGGYTNLNSYDSAGNPTSFKGTSRTFNNANQNTASTYDGNGNPTTYKGQTLSFDPEDRMTAYGSVMTAGYRVDGMRAWKQNSAGRTYYLYDGDILIEELDATGSKTAVMTWNDSRLLSRTTATRTLLYTYDGIGQLSQQVDAATGNVVATYLFDAWGSRAVSSSDPTAPSDPFSGYNTAAGYVTDWETGLQLLQHRYFDPSLGQFLTRDPLGIAGGVNLYEYADNMAAGKADPSGLTEVITMPNPGTIAGKGCQAGGMGALLQALAALIKGGPSDNCQLNAALCSALMGCVLGLLIWSLIVGTPEGWAMLAFLGCLAGAITALVNEITSAACNWLMCRKTPNIGCLLMTAPLRALAGCIGGALLGNLGGAIRLILINLGLGAAIGGLQQACEN